MLASTFVLFRRRVKLSSKLWKSQMTESKQQDFERWQNKGINNTLGLNCGISTYVIWQQSALTWTGVNVEPTVPYSRYYWKSSRQTHFRTSGWISLQEWMTHLSQDPVSASHPSFSAAVCPLTFIHTWVACMYQGQEGAMKNPVLGNSHMAAGSSKNSSDVKTKGQNICASWTVIHLTVM